MSASNDLALVVGGSTGVGAAVAKLLSHTHAVHTWSRSASRSSEQAMHSLVDVRRGDDVEAAVKSLAVEPAAVVYCAGVAHWGNVGEQSASEWLDVLDVNIVGLVRVLGAIKCRWGRYPEFTAVIGSEADRFGAANRSAYHASKAGLANLVDSLRLEARASGGGRITLVTPGKVDTDFSGSRGLRPAISAEDVASGVVWAMRQPPHVEIRHLELARTGAPFAGRE